MGAPKAEAIPAAAPAETKFLPSSLLWNLGRFVESVVTCIREAVGPIEPSLAGKPAGLGLELGEESSDHADKVD